MSAAWHRPRLWQGAWVVMILAVVAGSLMPARELPAPLFPHFDKLQHFAGYCVLAAWAAMIFERAALLRAALALVALGLALELAQGALTTSRAADPLDALTNTAGVGAGALLAWTPARAALRWLDRRLFGPGLAPM